MDYLGKYKEILQNLTLYGPTNRKIRYGRNGDGGYVIVDGYKYDCFISAGIDDEISFETDFIKYNPNIPYIAFDGTVDRPHNLPENIIFHKKNIGVANTELTTNLKDIIDSHNDIFVKMDIEGEEWRWINSLGNSLKNIKQIVFEGHAFFPHLLEPYFVPQFPAPGQKPIFLVEHHCLGLSHDVWTDFILNSLKKLNETHHLVHIHQNTCAPFLTIMGNDYPTFCEITFLRNDCEINGLNEEDIPVPFLDYPSGKKIIPPEFIDRTMNYWPFKF